MTALESIVRGVGTTPLVRLRRIGAELPGVRIYGLTDAAAFDRRVPTVSFTVAGRAPEEIAAALGRRGIFSWSGNHYAVEPLARLGLAATNRVGLVHYNTAGEINRFLNALEDVAAARHVSAGRR